MKNVLTIKTPIGPVSLNVNKTTAGTLFCCVGAGILIAGLITLSRR